MGAGEEGWLCMTKLPWQVRSNGVVVVDNVLWYGRTADPLVHAQAFQL